MKRSISLIFSIFLLLPFKDISAQLFDTNAKFTHADTLRGALRPERTCFDVTAYNLFVEPDLEKRSLKGHNTIHFKVTENFNRMQVDLFRELNVDSVVFHGSTQNFTRIEDAFFIGLHKTLLRGTSDSITIFYSGIPRAAVSPPWDGGLSWEQDEQGRPWVGVSCQGLGASVWWPNKDHLSDEPDRMTITIVAPDPLMAVCNGNLISNTPAGEGKTAWKWQVSYPINNYNVTMNMGHYMHWSDTYKSKAGSTMSLDYYVLDYNEQKARKQFQQVRPMLNCYESYLGPYPFPEDGFALVETPYLGMEHQGAIAYGNKYRTGYLGFDYSGIGLDFDYIIIHEAGHEWWGNHVSMQDLADMWIHEAFCTYSESIYVECLYGNNKAMDYIEAKKKLMIRDKPLIGHYDVNNEGSGDMYPKGALILNTLRSITDNDSLWWAVLRGIQSEFGMQTVTTSMIEKYIAEKTGRDLSKIFDQYLRQTALPVLEYRITPGEGGIILEYHWVAATPGFNMPIRFFNANGELQWIKPLPDWQTIKLADLTERTLVFDTKHFLFEERVMRK